MLIGFTNRSAYHLKLIRINNDHLFYTLADLLNKEFRVAGSFDSNFILLA